MGADLAATARRLVRMWTGGGGDAVGSCTPPKPMGPTANHVSGRAGARKKREPAGAGRDGWPRGAKDSKRYPVPD